MTKNVCGLPLLELLNESREDGEDMEILHLDSGVLHFPRSSFVVLVTEVADFYINSPESLTALHALRFYRFNEQLRRQLHNLLDELNTLVKQNFFGFINDKLSNVPE